MNTLIKSKDIHKFGCGDIDACCLDDLFTTLKFQFIAVRFEDAMKQYLIDSIEITLTRAAGTLYNRKQTGRVKLLV